MFELKRLARDDSPSKFESVRWKDRNYVTELIDYDPEILQN